MSRKKEILNEGLKSFGIYGYQDTTISQIAEKAGVSDATIYQHFKSKEDLLFNIPEEKMEEVIQLADLHLQGIRGALNKIRKFVWLYLWFFQTNRDWASIVMIDLKTNKKFLETPGYSLVKKFTAIVLNLIEEGKKEGSVRKEVNPYIFRSMLLGLMENLSIRWLLVDKPKNLVDYADDAADLLIQAVKT
jgi:TetR/AcrR family transcriptional regulator, fatty acid metabolism regulator protein